MPVQVDRCKYTVDWVADKLRWRLSADVAEVEALDRLAEQCPTATVTYEQALYPPRRPFGPAGQQRRPRGAEKRGRDPVRRQRNRAGTRERHRPAAPADASSTMTTPRRRSRNPTRPRCSALATGSARVGVASARPAGTAAEAARCASGAWPLYEAVGHSRAVYQYPHLIRSEIPDVRRGLAGDTAARTGSGGDSRESRPGPGFFGSALEPEKPPVTGRLSRRQAGRPRGA